MSVLIRFLTQPWAESLGWALVHFLWQGILIAAIYAIARNLWGNSRTSAFRYILACTALLAMVVAPIATFVISASPESTQSIGEIAGPIVSSVSNANANWLTSLRAQTLHTKPHQFPGWIVLIWSIGMVGFLARLAGGWMLAMSTKHAVRPAPAEWQQTLERLRRRLRVFPRVRLAVSSSVQVPVVIGWLRPLVLVPLCSLTGMEQPLIEALLAHELAHIQRRDYLINLLQGIVESALFYHPAVWWISGHIRHEREFCCDEIAVSACGNPFTYACALTELEALRPTHAYPVLASTGGSLIDRIARLLGANRPAPPIATPGLGIFAIGALVALTLAVRSFAEITIVAPSSLPAFEVASIKPSSPDSQLKIDFAAGGRLLVTHATLRFLMKIAYDISDDQIVGGPAWVSNTRFDIQAKPAIVTGGDPQTMTKEQILLFHEPIRLRLQRLLADRFQLEVRKESKPMPIFALVPVKSGPRMKKDSSPGDPKISIGAGRGLLTATRVDMPTLARFLSEGQVGRPVIDTTGLTGTFDFSLEWTPDPSLNPSVTNQQPTADAGTSIFTALQQQLGLKLEPRTSSSDYLVVTRAELPSAN